MVYLVVLALVHIDKDIVLVLAGHGCMQHNTQRVTKG